ncbi:HsdR family type I site-specific deoxyribonuclease [Gordonia pseudamarae]|jgi:type I restriction enzyme R subunit|uniref:Type I restriction enzyme endonuclease subunit n=1 Tax=Gordonia pseudamarae TaxID=2831662 RepID=A0ABX6IPX5_9ACTN|nr:MULTISPECIES: type I restriction endonuclease subunit R [Gordonia]MBD0022269.1 type I restriction endonuclease subunit R [Gordonia sp. (in: high G+C Gram-positive bacteria)]QHN28274.1 HsdR family type I site-specific deoxyribonuclease [Gordonia pseudamarae]QHN37136.1 HsdR family type I site-specific deoxyribonuclease [Gordonia pseudamarae]
MSIIPESEWEQFTVERLAEHNWQPLKGQEIAPGTERGRVSWEDLVLPERLLSVMRELNRGVPHEYLVQARAAILAPQSQDPMAENYRLHQIVTRGYRGITYIDHNGIEQTPTIRVASTRPDENELLAVRQVTIRSREHERRFDVVLYLNGLPVAIFELKQAGAAGATVSAAHAQLRTYLREFPMAFRFAVVTVISDGLTARYGTPFTPLEHYAPWNVDDDGKPVETGKPVEDDDLGVELESLIDGVFNTERFVQLQHNFVAYDAGADGYVKRIAKPHQYFAVTKAVGNTVVAAESTGKAGVVWHTQGSGKSMEMELYAHLVAKQPKLKNPTIIVVTDRRDLDGQLFDTFNRSRLLGESPVKIGTRDELRHELADRTTGGIYFTTLQKFGRTKEEREAGADHPLLTDRRNVIVIVDEAHRSHYDDLDGYARHLADAVPNATLIAFTGTPISSAERNTRDVFGPYIDIYDLTRAVDDGATVPVYFEPRLIKVSLAEQITEDDLDRAADEATRGLDDVERAQIEKSVAVINAVYGAPQRLKALAADIVAHWETRMAAMVPFIETSGKALVVGATRDICARLYDEIIALKPDWHNDSESEGVIKVIYSGSAKDQEPISRHVRRDAQNKAIQKRLKDPDDPLRIVIVKDMLLTGFDAPPLHTLYLDRPLKGALLMQTLARVNRTFRGKPAGLLVAYAPLAENLNAALAEYTDTDQQTRPVGKRIDEAAGLARETLAQIDTLCAGYDWRAVVGSGRNNPWMRATQGLANHLLAPDTPGVEVDGQPKPAALRFRELAATLARAWALAGGDHTLAELRPDIKFYAEVRVWMGKIEANRRQAEGKPIPDDIRRLLSRLVADSTASGEVVDIYAAAGLPTPSLNDLTPEFEATARAAANPHLAIEALRATLTGESRRATRNSLVRQRAFSDRITELMRRYTNQQVTSAEVIAELIAMAHDIAAEGSRGQNFNPPLSDDELAFFDAVAANKSAVELQGNDVLADIARELVHIMQRDTKYDWTVRDDVRAKLRSSVKRVLVKFKYPPDKQPEAIKIVIEQMEALAPGYAERHAALSS